MISPTIKRGLAFIGSAFALAAAGTVGYTVAQARRAPVVGSFTVISRAPGFVIAAPHGDFDTHTGTMARAIGERLQWSCLIANGFETEGPRLNVNRPTEGVRKDDTIFSTRASKVYGAYLKEMARLAPQVRLYVELHGNGHTATRNRVEIATAGISEAWAQHIRSHMDRALTQAGMEQYSTHIDVLERVHYGASHNREFGVLSEIQPALHIELPRQAREEHREQVIAALANALSKVAQRVEDARPFTGGQS